MADACVFIMNLDKHTAADTFFCYPKPCFVNVGCGLDHTILELAEMISNVVGFDGQIRFDTSKPDGSPQKLMDLTRLKKLGWQSKIGLLEGLQETYRWYLQHVDKLQL
jgi:GDP-L-fucose synthase